MILETQECSLDNLLSWRENNSSDSVESYLPLFLDSQVFGYVEFKEDFANVSHSLLEMMLFVQLPCAPVYRRGLYTNSASRERVGNRLLE